MFLADAQAVIALAKDDAFAKQKASLDIESLLAAMAHTPPAMQLLARFFADGDAESLRIKCPELDQTTPCPIQMDINPWLRELFAKAAFLASGAGEPDLRHPGMIGLSHLAAAVALNQEACRSILSLEPISSKKALAVLAECQQQKEAQGSLGRLVSRLRVIRQRLLGKVFGQDHAVHTFLEGLYHSQVSLAVDKEARRPSAVFVFAGPPGVGKTYLSELSASYLGRPFKRFDMTAYADHQAFNQLIGFEPSYKGAQPGTLTGFVKENPNAILLFDEIEKAHLSTIQLFYQVLDAGTLEDKYSKEQIPFRDSVIIFTTNAGGTLYDNPNRQGIVSVNADFHRQTILSALANEKNPATGHPAFPQALCSRLAQGYPVMFNHLGMKDLEKLAETALDRTKGLFEEQYFIRLDYDPLLTSILIFKEGGRVDARQLKTEAERFLQGELYRYISLFTPQRLEDELSRLRAIMIAPELEGGQAGEIAGLLRGARKPKVLLVCNPGFAQACRRLIPMLDWRSSASVSEVLAILATEQIDMVLLDLWVGSGGREDGGQGCARVGSSDTLEAGTDFTPLASSALHNGRQILRAIHERSSDTPVYLLSLDKEAAKLPGRSTILFDQSQAGDAWGGGPRRPVDDELFLACVRAGGARGLLKTGFRGDVHESWELLRDEFAENVFKIANRLFLEETAGQLASGRKVLQFESCPLLDKKNGRLLIRLRNFRFSRAPAAEDQNEMVEAVDRPSIGFDDVFGAKAAKESLRFVVEWLQDPKRYMAMGLRPPKGVLLTGPPGTGKTMLARALAGESNCAFVEKSATGFVTVWQGSGPQNVRDLFARARRYAPSIVFIDEIDAIGVARSGAAGGGRANENTLNALLVEMDGFSANSRRPVIVFAATNLADRLDPALRRRFDREVEVDRPDLEARLAYLNNSVARVGLEKISQACLQRIAKQTLGMTIADLEKIIYQASVLAVRAKTSLSDEFLEEALAKLTLGDAREAVNPKHLLRTARHEAGHAVVAWLGGTPVSHVTIVGRGDTGGRMVREVDENQGVYTKRQLEQMIREAMGGRAAELLYYGDQGGLSTGASSDLRNASQWASRMVAEFGMSEDIGPMALPAKLWQSDGPLSMKVNQASRRILSDQQDLALNLLRQNRERLDVLVDELMARNRLTKEELARILPQRPEPQE